ncbi:Alpha/Beta hydrolase protein [Aspergillus crustosus]
MPDPITFICDRRFHRRITLDTQHGPLNVSYADIGCATGPTLLYLPGMFASRYLGIPMHLMAERAGVRLVVVDRPGMGASTNVEPGDRIAVWLDMLPRLLAHLNIQRVNLVSHSAGAIFLLNTWARYRELIAPVVTLLAPWVDPAHSRVVPMQLAQYVPTKAFAIWHQIPRFFVTQASPVFASSGALVRKMSMSSGLSGGASQDESDRTFLDANYRRIERDYGVPVKESAELSELAVQYMFSEETVGGNGEALQCLRKTKGSDWGACEDYAGCARTLGQQEREGGGRGSVKLRVYHAETDSMVGKKGQRYVDECWNLGEGYDGIEYTARMVKGTDHDTVSQAVEVWEEIFASVQ